MHNVAEHITVRNTIKIYQLKWKHTEIETSNAENRSSFVTYYNKKIGVLYTPFVSR